jgi:uncharacterized membrane protein YheB (UPF0754 family)
MNKGLVTNIIALFLVIVSFFINSDFSIYFYYSGLFALSGALTNQIAIYMIFHKVPFIYGSGVIELNFEKFKKSLKQIIMEQFFTKERIEQFLKLELQSADFKQIIEKTDFNPAFDSLKESIKESKFGGFLNMVGGESALEPLRDTFSNKLKKSLISIFESDSFKNQLNGIVNSANIPYTLIEKVDIIIDKRLNELNPKEVRDLVNSLIKEHLDWLVVWGGLFGGLIGLVSAIIYPY